MTPDLDMFDDPRLTAYVLGELEGEDRAQLELEIAQSPALAAEVESLRRSAAIVSMALAAEPMRPMRLSGEQRSRIAVAGESVALPRVASRGRRGGRWSALGPVAIALAAAVMIIVQVSPLAPQTSLIASNFSDIESVHGNTNHRYYFRELGERGAEAGQLGADFPRGRSATGVVNGTTTDGRRFLLYAEIEDQSGEKLRKLSEEPEVGGGLQQQAEGVGEDQPASGGDLSKRQWSRQDRLSVAAKAPAKSVSESLGAILEDQSVAEPAEVSRSKQKTLADDENGNGDDFSKPVQQRQNFRRLDRLRRTEERLTDRDSDGNGLWEFKTHDFDVESAPSARPESLWSDLNVDAYGLAFAVSNVAQQDFVEITPLPASVAWTRAECDGRYSELIEKISAPVDVLRYGRFHDAGQAEIAAAAGRANLPSGFRVYVAPDWYIWGRRNDDRVPAGEAAR